MCHADGMPLTERHSCGKRFFVTFYKFKVGLKLKSRGHTDSLIANLNTNNQVNHACSNRQPHQNTLFHWRFIHC